MISCLPGRVAVMVPDMAASLDQIAVPDAIRERYLAMNRPPYPLLRGIVTAVGMRRGPVAMPEVGDSVWVLPRPGLIIEPHDIDISSIGAMVPEGHTLRLYGVGDAWFDQIVGYTEGETPHVETQT